MSSSSSVTHSTESAANDSVPDLVALLRLNACIMRGVAGLTKPPSEENPLEQAQILVNLGLLLNASMRAALMEALIQQARARTRVSERASERAHVSE